MDFKYRVSSLSCRCVRKGGGSYHYFGQCSITYISVPPLLVSFLSVLVLVPFVGKGYSIKQIGVSLEIYLFKRDFTSTSAGRNILKNCKT